MNISETLCLSKDLLIYPIIDGVTGYLVNTAEEAYERAPMLIKKPWLARMLGANGHQHVKRNFLTTRDLRDYLRIHIDLVAR